MKLASGDVDVHVGKRMRRRREVLGISQGRLGRELGVPFGQIQKWEKGANRIGAGRLYQIADIFGVTPNWFYEGLEPPGPAASPADKAASPDEVRALVDAFVAIPDPDARASVLAMVRSMGGSDADGGHIASRDEAPEP